MRAEEVAELLDVKGVMDGSEFLAMVQAAQAANALGDYDWLPPGLTTLEGYLFPTPTASRSLPGRADSRSCGDVG